VADFSKSAMTDLAQFEPDVFWEQHGTKIVLAGLSVLAVGVGLFLWQRHAAEMQEAAATRLAAANSAPMLQQIIQDYPGKEPAAQAWLRLADMQFQSGKYTEAAGSYQKFLDQYPKHPLTESALLGQAASQEALGNFAAAKSQYEMLINVHPQGYALLAAKLGLARSLESLGQPKEARQVYEEVMAAAQGSPWSMAAYMRWVVLRRDLPPESPKSPAAQLGSVIQPSGTTAAPTPPPTKP
jgi:tetratricopeptide (TPR) repeat protein